MNGVKEQTSHLYAQALTSTGLFTTLTFDASYQGESSGTPRGLENPHHRVEDIKAAVSYLTTLPEIDSERIGVLGICASGGYVVHAASSDVRIKAVGTVSAACMGRLTREGLLPGASLPESQLQASLLASTAARTSEANGSPPQIVPLLPPSYSDLPEQTPTLTKQAWHYYKTPRGAHPRSNAIQPVRSTDMLATYDSFAFAWMVAPRPLLMIVGSEADTAYFSRDAVGVAREPKELFMIEGKTHVDLYDELSESVPKLVEFYGETLCEQVG